jgi:cell division septal protein FtsQ
LISWNHLNVKEIEVVCQKADVREEIQEFFKNKNLGNILLLDIGHVQELLESHRWVKNACVRKIFPSSLRIEIEERKPMAILKKENFYLIDKQGILLEKIQPQEYKELPLLIDSNNFERDYKEKLELAWRCLESLAPSERENIEILDLTDYGNITAKLRSSGVNLKLGGDNFLQKLKIFQEWRSNLERFGPLEYVDLRFQDRLYIKPQQHPVGNFIPNSEKEAK